MSYGFATYNPSGFLKIDSNNLVFSAIMAGITRMYYYEEETWGTAYPFGQGLVIPQKGNTPLPFWRAPINRWIFSNSSEEYVSTTLITFVEWISDGNSAVWMDPPIEFVIADHNDSLRLTTSASNGLIINNSTGIKVFDSRWRVFNLDGVIWWSASINTTQDIYLPAPVFGKRYFYFPLRTIYFTQGNNVPIYQAVMRILSETRIQVRGSWTHNGNTYVSRDNRGQLIPIYTGYMA